MVLTIFPCELSRVASCVSAGYTLSSGALVIQGGKGQGLEQSCGHHVKCSGHRSPVSYVHLQKQSWPSVSSHVLKAMLSIYIFSPFIYFICMCHGHPLGSEENCVGPRDQTKIIALIGKHLRSHLLNPITIDQQQ